jgi:galactoside O-acetyltransferase
VTHAREEEVLARIAEGLVYTESEAAFQAPLRCTEQIFSMI